MNYDKKLAKYAKQINNPKYYGKILNILEQAAAEEENYEFKDFNDWDLYYITNEIISYYDAVTTKEEDERMIRYCNKQWFIVSDKNCILYETEFFKYALIFYIKSYFLMLIARIIRFFHPNRIIKAENIGSHMVMVQGAVNVKGLENNIF